MASFCYINPLSELGLYPVTSINSIVRLSRVHQSKIPFSFGNASQPTQAQLPKRCQWRFFNCKETRFENSYRQERTNISQATLIWRAIKLPIYSVAIIPLMVGSAAAYLQTGQFSLRSFLGPLVSSIFIITWLNLSNDVYDFDTGADKYKQESVVNIIGSRTGTLVAANLLLGFGLSGLVLIALESGNVRSVLLLLSAVVCGYVYQCPPFRLSYHGLGEPLCFAAFGPFATTAFYLMQITPRELCYPNLLTSTILSVSVLVGCTTTLILFCSHFHQIDGDREVGKFSPLVRVGKKAGSKLVKIGVIVLYGNLFILGVVNALPLACTVLCAFTIPMGNAVVSFVEKNYEDDKKIFMAKYYCVRLHALFGLALAAGLVLARRLCKYSPFPTLA